jgi:hypothetical protein
MVNQINRVLPLYLLPSLDWFAEAIGAEVLTLGDEEQFTKQTERNRLNYGTFQGTKTFSIPIIHSSTSRGYNEVLISYETNWPQQLVNALRTAYGKSPFFEYYGYRFEAIILSKPSNLWTLNFNLLNEIINCLKIDIPILVQKIKAINSETLHEVIPYYQVFSEKIEFQPNLTILDLIYNEGPDAIYVLRKMNNLSINI